MCHLLLNSSNVPVINLEKDLTIDQLAYLIFCFQTGVFANLIIDDVEKILSKENYDMLVDRVESLHDGVNSINKQLRVIESLTPVIPPNQKLTHMGLIDGNNRPTSI